MASWLQQQILMTLIAAREEPCKGVMSTEQIADMILIPIASVRASMSGMQNAMNRHWIKELPYDKERGQGRWWQITEAGVQHMDSILDEPDCQAPPYDTARGPYGFSYHATWWEHRQRRTHYMMMGTATVQCEGRLHDGDEVKVYVGEDGKMWVRRPREFLDGRFRPLHPPKRDFDVPGMKISGLWEEDSLFDRLRKLWPWSKK